MLKYILGLLFLVSTASAQTAIGVFDELQNQSTTKNWVSNPHAEKNAASVVAYADAAGTDPVDAVGGSPTVSCTRSSSSPIDGLGSFLLTKDASNRQGEGCAWTVKAISTSMKAKVVSVEFDYLLSSGTFVAGTASARSDVTVWVIPLDGSDTTAKQLSTISLFSNSTTIADKFSGYFQTASDTTQYRIALHVGSASASAYTLKIDSVRFSQAQYVYGTPITDWQSFTPTGSWVSNTTYTGFYRRVGDKAEIKYNLAITGTPTSAALTVNMPTGLTIDTAKLPSAIAGITVLSTQGNLRDTGTINIGLGVMYSSTSAFAIYSSAANNTYTSFPDAVTQASPFTFANTDTIQFEVAVPISGWSSSVQISDRADTRVVALNVNKNSGNHTSSGGWQKVSGWLTPTLDTHAAFNATTGDYTIPVSGTYAISGAVGITFGTSTTTIGSSVSIDGTRVSPGGVHAIGTLSTGISAYTVIKYLNAGQVVSVEAIQDESASEAYNSSDNLTNLNIFKISGSSAIAATGTVGFSANTSTTAATTSAPFVFTNVLRDTHGMYNASTGIATIPAPGWFQCNWTVYFNAGQTANLYVDGSQHANAGNVGSASSASSGDLVRYFNAGQTIQIRPDANVTATGGAVINRFSCIRIGL